MILLLFVIVAIGSTVIAWQLDDSWFGALGLVLGIFAWAAVAITGACVVITNIGVDGTIAANQQLYDSLVYQLENNLYDNDNDVGKQELYEKVTEWNTDLACRKALQNDFWIGIFYPNIYDQFDFIELSAGAETISE